MSQSVGLSERRGGGYITFHYFCGLSVVLKMLLVLFLQEGFIRSCQMLCMDLHVSGSLSVKEVSEYHYQFLMISDDSDQIF